MPRSQNDQHKKIPSKIIGIQFSILSPDEIRAASVAEITSRDTYINNKPVIGGLFDPRMGVIDHGKICPTDGLDNRFCPGYFGHIELARPVFHVQFIPIILKILKCICIRCSKLLIDKNLLHDKGKISLQERQYLTIPYLGKGKVETDLETKLRTGAQETHRKTATKLSERSFIPLQNTPMIPEVASKIQNPSNLIEGAASSGWIRGGLPSREYAKKQLN